MKTHSRSYQEQSEAEFMVTTLNDLIGVCRAGYNGYLEAAEGIASSPYKTMFAEYAHQRDRFSADLANFILDLGGAVTGANSSVERGWVNIRVATTKGDPGTILAECTRAEEAAKQVYEQALDNPLPENIHNVVQTQYDLIVRAQNRIRALRDKHLK